jgi:ParB/RepB/Spo0J family partition protein
MPKQSTADALAEANAAVAARPKARGRKAKDPTSAGPPVGLAPVVELAVDAVVASPDNPRRSLGPDDALEGLAQSIRTHGILEPILVGPAGDDGTHEVIAGHRRLEGARRAGLMLVPAIVRADLVGPLADEARLIENLQRVDLDPIDEAHAMRKLLDLGYSQARLAERLGRNQSNISKRLALLKLPEDVQAKVGVDQHYPVGVAVELAKLTADKAAFTRARNKIESGNYGDPLNVVSAELEKVRQARAVAKRRSELEAAGVTVVDWPPNGYWYDSDGRTDRPLAGRGYYGDMLRVDRDLHVGRPCHGIALSPHGTEILVCTDPASHADEVVAPPVVAPPKESKAQTRARKEAEAEAEAEREAAMVKAAHSTRGALVEKLAATPPGRPTMAAHVGLTYLQWREGQGWDLLSRAFELAKVPWPVPDDLVDTLDDDPEVYEWIVTDAAQAKGVDPLHLAFVVALLVGEQAMADRYDREEGRWGTWADWPIGRLHLELLVAQGYEPHPREVEALAEARAELARRWEEITEPETKGETGPALTPEQLAAEGRVVCPVCQGAPAADDYTLCGNCLGAGTVATVTDDDEEAEIPVGPATARPEPVAVASARCPASGTEVPGFGGKAKKAPKASDKVTCPECATTVVVTLTGKFRAHDKAAL